MRILVGTCMASMLMVGVAHAQLFLSNDATLDMTGSPGSQIIFPDGSTLASSNDLGAPLDHGGTDNTVGGDGAFIGGGTQNVTSGTFATIGGGNSNGASGYYGATVAGGTSNFAQGSMSTVAGGLSNIAGLDYASVGGGNRNIVEARYGTIAGGGPSNESDLEGTRNIVYDEYGTIGGGGGNVVGNNDENTSGQTFGTISGGRDNQSIGIATTVGGGASNIASGAYSTVPGGQFNATLGSYSFAAGRHAKANHSGSFVWSDDSGTPFETSAAKTFLVRASGGIALYTSADSSNGVTLGADESSWNNLCDRNAKENFVKADGEDVLNKLSRMPVMFFNYKGVDPDEMHIGVMAQDFNTAFPVGKDPLRISTQDADGVAFAAIQGLNVRLRRAQDELVTKQAQIESLETRLAALEAAMTGLQP